MTNREQEILEILKRNPMISQKELADMLGITRSSAAVHITNLLKKGCILGKGYIVRNDAYVCIIGGSNMDIQGFPSKNLKLRDSNPGVVKISLGGVGRNIGENLVKLGVETKLVTALGDDIYGNKILDEARLIGLNMQDALIFNNYPTSTYISILDGTGDMMAAIAHMDIFDKITINHIKDKKHVIQNSKLCIIDTNIPEDVIEYIVTNYKDKEYILDTVSTAKAMKVKNIIGSFHTIKPNKLEAEMLSGIEIKRKTDLKKAAEYFINKGVKRVFITLGEDGVYYSDGGKEGHVKTPKINVVNATGAGDAFVAALAYSHFYEYDIDYTAKFAMAASILALSHEDTINPNISFENVNMKMKELELC